MENTSVSGKSVHVPNDIVLLVFHNQDCQVAELLLGYDIDPDINTAQGLDPAVQSAGKVPLLSALQRVAQSLLLLKTRRINGDCDGVVQYRLR